MAQDGGREGKGRKGKEREGKGREGKEREGKGRCSSPVMVGARRFMARWNEEKEHKTEKIRRKRDAEARPSTIDVK